MKLLCYHFCYPSKWQSNKSKSVFLKLGFTLCKTEQPLQGMELQEREAQKD